MQSGPLNKEYKKVWLINASKQSSVVGNSR